jgi:histone deacetylase 1/2
VANGTGMEIDCVGHSKLHSQNSVFHLNKILHVPNASKSLISANYLACDNNAYFKFHPHHFFYQGTGDEENPP